MTDTNRSTPRVVFAARDLLEIGVILEALRLVVFSGDTRLVYVGILALAAVDLNPRSGLVLGRIGVPDAPDNSNV